MRIKKINIRNFRKLLNCTLDFGEQHTVLVGANNSGKTSCMHAVISFLKDSGRFSTKDFTLTNWKAINEVADGWIKAESPNPQLSDLVDYLPQMDLWISVGTKEAYLVKDLIPSLDWEGKQVGVRIVYAPKDIEKLFSSYKEAYTKAEAIKKAREGSPIDIYPTDLWDYLNRGKLSSIFTLRYYILDIKKDKDGAQPLPDVEFEEGSPLEKLIKIDYIDAQRDFSDPDRDDNSNHNKLSKQLQDYYDRHIKPKEESIEAQDLGIIEALHTANAALDENIGKAFETRINELKNINYPGFHDPSIKIHSFVDVKNSISHKSAVQFALGDDEAGLTLPEDYNGLGFQNLISMYFRLIQFRDVWLHEGRMVKNGSDDGFIEPIHLVFIEEPEAHLHAQAQQVFVKKAYSALCNSPKLVKGGLTTQLVLSTHSNHIVHEVSLNDMRYFQRCKTAETNIPLSRIVNLKGVFGKDKETEKFVTRYIRLSQCDIFFADAIVLVEGSGERILMPEFFKNEGMTSNYVSIIEINGSHAHRFKDLVERLDIPCLIVTDIDAQECNGKDKNGNDKYEKSPTKKGQGQITNNDTLRKWLPKEDKIDTLLDLDTEKKESGNVRVAYQTGVKAKLNDDAEESIGYPYTFEDALALSNVKLFKNSDLKGKGLVTNFMKIITSGKTVEDCCQSMFNTLTPAKKAPFAINLLYLDEFEELKTPEYIKEGLLWLKAKLNENKNQNGTK